MALVEIRSTNPEFSYVIAKNPATGMLVKENRQGFGYGYFVKDDPSRYMVYFRDSDTEVSYKSHPNETFEFVNTTRYASAMWPINAIGDFLGTAFKKTQPQDTPGFDNRFIINMMYVKNPKYLEIFSEYFKDFTLQFTETAQQHYRIEVSTTRTIRDLLSYVNLLTIFNVLRNQPRQNERTDRKADHLDVDEATAIKYLGCLNVIDAPYFVRYIFKCNLLRGRALFAKMVKDLERTERHDKIELTRGSNDEARHTFVRGQAMAMGDQILDVGCGEGNFMADLAPHIEGFPYYAVDTNPECVEDTRRRADRKQLDNVLVFGSLDDIPSVDLQRSTTVLLVEVIEHMPIEDARLLVKKILKEVNVSQLIITTPNKDFNRFYNFDDDQARHDDHHFELTAAEFNDFVTGLVPDGYIVYSPCPVGDQVDGVATTVAAVIKKKEVAVGDVESTVA